MEARNPIAENWEAKVTAVNRKLIYRVFNLELSVGIGGSKAYIDQREENDQGGMASLAKVTRGSSATN